MIENIGVTAAGTGLIGGIVWLFWGPRTHAYVVPVTSTLSMSDPPDAVPIIILYVLAPVLDQLLADVRRQR